VIQLWRSLVQVWQKVWYRCDKKSGTGVTKVWYRCDISLVQVWQKSGTGVTKVWFTRIQLGSHNEVQMMDLKWPETVLHDLTKNWHGPKHDLTKNCRLEFGRSAISSHGCSHGAYNGAIQIRWMDHIIWTILCQNLHTSLPSLELLVSFSCILKAIYFSCILKANLPRLS